MQVSLIGLIFTGSIVDLAKYKFLPTYTRYRKKVEDFYLYTSRNSEQELYNEFYSLCRIEITKWVIHVVTAKKCRSIMHFHTRSVPGLARTKASKEKLRFTLTICIDPWGTLYAKIYRRIQQRSLNRRTVHFLQQNRRIKFKSFFESEWGLHNMPRYLHTCCVNNSLSYKLQATTSDIR